MSSRSKRIMFLVKHELAGSSKSPSIKNVKVENQQTEYAKRLRDRSTMEKLDLGTDSDTEKPFESSGSEYRASDGNSEGNSTYLSSSDNSSATKHDISDTVIKNNHCNQSIPISAAIQTALFAECDQDENVAECDQDENVANLSSHNETLENNLSEFDWNNYNSFSDMSTNENNAETYIIQNIGQYQTEKGDTAEDVTNFESGNETQSATAPIEEHNMSPPSREIACKRARTSLSNTNLSSSESDCSRGIYVRSSKKNKNGKRKREKKHSCFICYKIVCNLPRHLEKLHSKDVEVARVLALQKGSKKRRDEYSRLQRVGDFYHNCEVLNNKQGELLLLRLPTIEEKKKYSYQDYGPCPDCLGFLLKHNMSAHLRRCPDRQNMENRDPITESNALLQGMHSTEIPNEFYKNVIQNMLSDSIGKIVREDNMILKFGSMLYENKGTEQVNLIRQQMRQLGRLVQEMSIQLKNKISLEQCLSPNNFDKLVECTKSICSVSTSDIGRPEFQVPSLGLKIGHHLKKCANFSRGTALRRGELKRDQELQAFLCIHDLEWKIRISSNALYTLHKRKFNCAQLLPITEDLIKLNSYIKDNIKIYYDKLMAEAIPSLYDWSTLASLILTRIILFNKKRSGDAAKMTLDQYARRPLWSEQCTQELKSSLSPIEQKLAEKLILVDVEGKRGRRVPVLLTNEVKLGIDILIAKRKLVQISNENLYVFPRSGTSVRPLRGYECLTRFAKKADLQFPENVSSTKLRKYIATVSQIFNLSENQTDWLARHLGHDIRVHRDFYRLHESAVELTKVSKILMAVDQGQVSKYAGKSLDQIEIKDLSDVEENSDKESECEEEETENLKATVRKPKSKRSDLHTSLPKNIPKPNKKENKSKAHKVPWNDEEKAVVFKYFKIKIKNKVLPGKEECEKCISDNSVLTKRSWKNIKDYVRNQMTKIENMKKKVL